MKSICVYCGSSLGARKEYVEEARKLGQLLAQKNMTLVYGGSSIGIMGVIANAVLDAGGEVIGVLPRFLDKKEIAHNQLTELKVVDSMHERKMLMSELSDGFIALPGGLGTLEEFFEILTWGQLGMHQKPCGLLNVKQYFRHLIDFLDYSVNEHFVKEVNRAMILVDENPERLLQRFEGYTAPKVKKWIVREET